MIIAMSGFHLIQIGELMQIYREGSNLSIEDMHQLFAIALISSLLTVGGKNLDEVILFLKKSLPRRK